MDTPLSKEFLDYLRLELNRSEKTVGAYALDLRQFVSFLSSRPEAEATPADELLASVCTRDIRSWLASEARDGVQPRSLRRKTQSLRAFYRWMLKRGKVNVNPATDITLAKTPRHLPEFALPSSLEAILAEPYDSANEDEARTHLILHMLYATGMRQAELLAIDDNDINFTSAEIRVTGKRNKQRVIPVAPQLLDEIRTWQSLRDSIYPDHDCAALFITRHGRMSKDMLYKTCRSILSRTGATRLGPHTLRHSFASAMVDAGADLNAVREILGHESLATTQIYTHLSFGRLTADYLRAHPRATGKNHSDQEKRGKE